MSAGPGSPGWRLAKLAELVDALLEGRIASDVGELILTTVGLCMTSPGAAIDHAPVDPARAARRAAVLAVAEADDAARAETPRRRRAMSPASLANLQNAREARMAKLAARRAENSGGAVTDA